MNETPNNDSRILLVDDDDEVRKALTKLLQHEGYSVVEQPDVNSAVRCLAKDISPFDLVITDVLMPDTNGMEFLRRLRADFPSLPVIVITAFGDWEQYGNAIHKGAVAYLCKPLEPDEFLGAVQAALHRTEPVLRTSPVWDGW